MKTINTMATVHDAVTGRRVGVKLARFHLVPPKLAGGECSVCAHRHEPHEPHNLESTYYLYGFYAEHGRWPTWRDALAHCSQDLREAWERELRKLGRWSE